jgi:single-strand selective monofunctional uracil DNA glycosylase
VTPSASELTLAAAKLRRACDRILADLRAAAPPPLAYVLNPLAYAWDNHATYIERFAPERAEAILLGMNPGPWGMGQTGVPFGSPDLVRRFLGIEGAVGAPASAHPKRPIEGLRSKRNEVSGQRLWGGIEQCFGAPGRFFDRFFVANYCPLLFLAESGANLTPDRLGKELERALRVPCDAHLAAIIRVLRPRTVIGVGKWAAGRARDVAEAEGLDVTVGEILHPSPASPLANRDWLGSARAQLEALGHAWPAPSTALTRARPAPGAPRAAGAPAPARG